jgi:hypothetical protein
MNNNKKNTPEEWHVPLFSSGKTWLKTALREMQPWKLHQDEIPFIIKLIENPNYGIARWFGGAVDLTTHDCIHVLLGRGILIKDEAFVIGYTMGSSKKMSPLKEKLFLFISKYLYPEGYRFGEEEAIVFKMAVIAGSKCHVDLGKVNFRWFAKWKLDHLRGKFGINKDFLKLCYILEKKKFLNSPESQRLI